MGKTKYLLTTSEDKCVIIAEVPKSHPHNEREYKVSSDMVELNVQNGLFTEITEHSDWGGRVWVFTEDL
jgi:hypothetical protein